MANRNSAVPLHSQTVQQTLQRLTSFFPFWRSRPQPQLRLCENLPLGERRFLSVVEFGRQKFLVGGTASSLAALAVLPAGPDCPRDCEEDVPTWKSVDGELVRALRHG